MSDSALPPRPTLPSDEALTIALVASEFNPEFTDALVFHARTELEAISPAVTIQTVRVPGAFEIPLAVELIAARCEVDAVIAFGVILEGETAHAMLLAESVTASLQQIGLRYYVPVLHGVLLMKNREQAEVRCQGEELNRGVEMARSAVATVQALKPLRTALARGGRGPVGFQSRGSRRLAVEEGAQGKGGRVGG